MGTKSKKPPHKSCSACKIKLGLNTISSVYMSTEKMHTVYNRRLSKISIFAAFRHGLKLVYGGCHG